MSAASDILQIPLLAGTPQSFTTSLSGVIYTLTLTYRDCDQGGWIMEIGDAAGNTIVAGIPLVSGANLIEQYTDLALPPGGLYVAGDPNIDEVPTFEGLGTSSFLYYLPA